MATNNGHENDEKNEKELNFEKLLNELDVSTHTIDDCKPEEETKPQETSPDKSDTPSSTPINDHNKFSKFKKPKGKLDGNR